MLRPVNMDLSTEAVWHDFSARLRRYFVRRARTDVVDDLLQETFLRVHNGLVDVRQRERLGAWVYQIARNVLIDHLRRSPRARAGDGADTAATVPDANFNEEVAAWLTCLLDGLAPHYRDAVRLAELDGLTQSEIAQRLGVPVSTLKSRVQRGRRKLKALLLQCCHLELDRRGNIVNYRARDGCNELCPQCRAAVSVCC